MTDTARTRESDSRTALENQVEAYKRDGFIIIEDVLQGGELSRAQAAFDRAQAVTRLDWEQGRALGRGVSENGEYYASGTFHGRKYFDIFPLHLLQEDDACVEMIAPRWGKTCRRRPYRSGSWSRRAHETRRRKAATSTGTGITGTRKRGASWGGRSTPRSSST